MAEIRPVAESEAVEPNGFKRIINQLLVFRHNTLVGKALGPITIAVFTLLAFLYVTTTKPYEKHEKDWLLYKDVPLEEDCKKLIRHVNKSKEEYYTLRLDRYLFDYTWDYRDHYYAFSVTMPDMLKLFLNIVDLFSRLIRNAVIFVLSVVNTDTNTLTYRVQLSNMSIGRKTEPAVTGNAYESLSARFRKAAHLLQLSNPLINELETPVEEISFRFSVELDSGTPATFKGYYVMHSALAGPAKGGLYYALDTDEDSTRFLAGCITWKAALAGIPFGGAKGGIVCDTAALSKQEKERVTIAYINALTEHIHARNNTTGNIVNNAPVTDWLLDEFSLQHGTSLHAVVTGKSTPNDSNSVRAQATGKGISQVTLLALAAKKKRPKKSSVAIQGFGNVGMHTALYLWEKGVKVVAASDADTALFNPEGIHIPDLIAYSESNGNSLYGYYDAYEILPGELLTLPVDVLIPAATQHVITAGNADSIKAPIIVEAANGPIHAEADIILQRKNTFVVPDILANAGGIIVSYLEWLQNSLHQPWSTDQIFQRQENILQKNFTDIVETADLIRDTLRTAAWLLAVKKIADTATVTTAITPALQTAHSQRN